LKHAPPTQFIANYHFYTKKHLFNTQCQEEITTEKLETRNHTIEHMENGNAQSTQIFSAAAPNLSPPNRQLEIWTTSSTSDNSYQLDTLFRNLPHFQSFVTPSFWFSKNTTLQN